MTIRLHPVVATPKVGVRRRPVRQLVWYHHFEDDAGGRLWDNKRAIPVARARGYITNHNSLTICIRREQVAAAGISLRVQNQVLRPRTGPEWARRRRSSSQALFGNRVRPSVCGGLAGASRSRSSEPRVPIASRADGLRYWVPKLSLGTSSLPFRFRFSSNSHPVCPWTVL